MTSRDHICMTAGDGATASSAAASGAGAFASVEIHRTLAGAEPAWREVMAHAYATPYQAPAFLGAWLANVAAQEGVAPLIVVAREAGGAVVAVLPLGLSRRFGLGVARFLGGAHVNFNLPVIRADRLSRFTPGETLRLLHEAARAGEIDGFALTNQPFVWNGRPNPFAALPSQPSLDPAFSGPLAATIDEHLALHVSAKTRSAQRRKLRRFDEHGAVRLYRATTADENEKVLAAYFRQKAERLAARGIDNVFEHPGIREFIRQAAGLDGGRQSIDLYGFELGGDVIATFGVIADQNRMCGMFNSITSCALARYSPGELLLNFMVEDAIGRGMRCFDLGVGAAPYKVLHCPNEEPLFDSVFGVTPLGRAGAAALGAKRAMMARIKANPTAYGLVTRLRMVRARTASPASDEPKTD